MNYQKINQWQKKSRFVSSLMQGLFVLASLVCGQRADCATIGLGLVAGNVTSPGSPDVTLQGLEVAAKFLLSSNNKISFSTVPLAVIQNGQLVMSGIDLGMSYFFVGGVPKKELATPGGVLTLTSESGMSIPFRVGYQSIGISNPTNPDSNISGQNIAIKTGFEYFTVTSMFGTIGIDILVSPFGVSGSTERISYSGFEAVLTWLFER